MDRILEAVKKLELEISSPEVRSSARKISALLHDDFEEFGKSGRRFTKADIVEELPSWDYQKIEIRNMALVRLSAGTVLVKYQTEAGGALSNRSSIWVKGGDSWQMIFHQGTPC